jgi:membrane fusion protein (multidrug efflux system)
MPYQRQFIERAALFVMAAILFLGCDDREANHPNPGAGATAAQQNAVPVQVVQVRAETFTETVRAVGTLRARAAVEIRPELTGILKEIHFQEGEKVDRGRLLFSIDDSKLTRELEERQEALKAVTAKLNRARKDFERAERLIDTRAVSESEWDRMQSALETAQAEVGQLNAAIELIRERLDDTKIRAPFSGVTAECSVDAGDYLRAGDHLITLYSLSPIEMSAQLPERYMGSVRKGQQAAVIVDAYPERRFSGTVTFVSPEVDERTRDFLVKITVQNEEGLLKPGAFGTILLTLRTLEDRPAVPEAALVATTEGYTVYVLEEGVARKRRVRVGLREAGLAELLEGAQIGETVVRAGHMRLSDGDTVKRVDRQSTGRQAASTGRGNVDAEGPAATRQEGQR